jgi:hypothetical protein
MPKVNQNGMHVLTARLNDSRYHRLVAFSAQMTVQLNKAISLNTALTMLVDTLPEPQETLRPRQRPESGESFSVRPKPRQRAKKAK